MSFIIIGKAVYNLERVERVRGGLRGGRQVQAGVGGLK